MMSEKMSYIAHLTMIMAAVWCTSVLSSEYRNMFEANSLLDTNVVTYKINVLTLASSFSCEKEFLSVTIDSNSVRTKWAGFNFSSPKLQNIAKALSPSDLRVGGIMADFLIFNSSVSKNKPEVEKEKDGDYSNFTMSGQQWDELTAFVKTVGWNLIFDFNVFLRKRGVWDSSNANLLLNYSAARNVQISGFQLGNEPAHYNRLFNVIISPSNLVADFKTLRNLLRSYSMYNGSHLYGPDATSGAMYSSSMTYVRQFIEVGGANVVDEISMHHYYLNGATSRPQDFVNIAVLNSLKNVLETTLNITSVAIRPVRIRLTETSSCYGDGAPNMSNAYVAGFMWLDKLGIAAQYGLSRVFRQSFFGGSYGLVALKKITPNPDYYLSVLFKRLVEGPVFPIILTPALGQLRVYANCARRDFYKYPRGSLVLYYLNLGTEKAILSLTQFPDEDREVYFLTPGDEYQLKSRLVKLNGQILSMNGDQLPEMKPGIRRGDIVVEGQSFGFIVIREAKVKVCGYVQEFAASGIHKWRAHVHILYISLFILHIIY